MKVFIQTLVLIGFLQVYNVDSARENSNSKVDVNLEMAEPCDFLKCSLPNCRCSDVKLCEKIQTEKIPQFVTVTFDDAVTALNFEYCDKIFENIRNPDGCSPSATFYFNHEYTDYTKIHFLWTKGHELALHSMTHGMGTSYWKEATVDVFLKEFGQQLEMIEHFAKIDKRDVKGMRVPHLQISGNDSFIAAKKLGLLYDSSWPTTRFTSPPLWPYTLDYKSVQDCPIGECPDASIPGLWENPLVSWEDTKGYKCAMLDACIHMPNDTTKDLVNWMISNFNRHYLTNRAPFGIYLHSAWFQKGEHYFEAFREFIRYLNKKPDVYFVSASQVIEYMRNPVEGKPFKECPRKHKSTCNAKMCQLRKIDSKDVRYMNVCGSCPAVYPWIENPLGLKITTF
ncbi:chitin deacetylase 8 [Episyrphus balteatus]|uniref:chitin deacetylase 8 n=1 Tax=Episyrphus balteatus TaxID=286459 RepID=UPI002484F439|nr:chitin deacetylase 8 [Episyrphus balteatus]